MRRRPEQDLQRGVAQLLDAAGFLWCHVPNGGARSRTEAAIMNGMGVKAGVPDILIFAPPPRMRGYELRPLSGVAIELKAGSNRETPAQVRWAEELEAAGWCVFTARNLDEVVAALVKMRWLEVA